MKNILQKGWMASKEVIIEDECLTIKTKSFKEDMEYKIKFQDLGFEIVKKKVKSANIPFYFFLILILMDIGLLISSVIDKEPFTQQLFWIFSLVFFSAIAYLSFFQMNKNVVYLTGGQKVLELLATKPNPETVSSFIEEIHKAIRNHYKKKYTVFEADIPFEVRTSQLKWLREIKAISDEEHNELLVNIKTGNIIGFKSND